MNKTIFAILIIFVAASFGCEAQTKLPKEMPPDVQMSYGSNGGMSPYYTEIEIEGETLSFKEKMPATNGKEVIWTAKLQAADKAGLYKLFIENNFDQIKNENKKDIVYDAGSEGVSLSFATNNVYNVQSGANFPLSAKNKTRYQTIAAEFGRLAKKYETMRETPVETSLDEARKQALALFETIYPSNPGKTMYSAKFTPFFASDWNNAKPFDWVSYVYASGIDPLLNDGVRIAKPFAKIVYKPATQTATLEKLTAKLVGGGEVQGVKPLPKDILEILNSEKEVEKILLQTKNRAALSAEDARKVVRFYENWKKYNGTVYFTFAGNHGEFTKWIDEQILAK